MKNLRISIVLLFIISYNLISKTDDFYSKGVNAFKIRDYKLAVKLLTKAIESKDNLKYSYYNRGLAHLYLNNFDKSIDDFNEVIRMDSTIADAYNNRGLCFGYLGNTASAIDDYNKAIALDNKFAQAYINRANIFIVDSDYDKARKDLDSAQLYEPNNPEIYFQLGHLDYNSDKYQESTENYSKAIKLGIKNAKIYYNRANAYFKNKQLNEALKDYTSSLELNPNDLEALNNRAYTYKALGEDSLANIDRSKLQEIKGGKLPPFETLKFKTFTNKTKDFSIDLPSNWKLIDLPNQNESIQFIITPEDIDPASSSMLVGVTVGITKNMNKYYPVKNESEILDFWKGSLDESNKGYLNYEVKWQRHRLWFGHGSILNESYLQVGENFIPFILYEYAIAYGNNLIFLYMQAPDFTFEYYRKIFDKALETIKLGKNYKLE